MAFNGSGCSKFTSGTAGRGPKKTPWTSSEDDILRKYVKMNGEGNWDLIQKKSGINKSGKSCRNRWANYLRPHLKKGAFSAEEETLIIRLHEELGNKWARIAAQLPNRTDNEVKNYWNIRLKKHQRAGLGTRPRPQEMSQINQPLNSSPLPTLSSLSASFAITRDSNGGIALSLINELCDYATSNDGTGDLVVMESELMQGTENKELGDGVRSLDEEFWRLLDAPLPVPIPEWDDLDPRPF